MFNRRNEQWKTRPDNFLKHFNNILETIITFFIDICEINFTKNQRRNYYKKK